MTGGHERRRPGSPVLIRVLVGIHADECSGTGVLSLKYLRKRRGGGKVLGAAPARRDNGCEQGALAQDHSLPRAAACGAPLTRSGGAGFPWRTT